MNCKNGFDYFLLSDNIYYRLCQSAAKLDEIKKVQRLLNYCDKSSPKGVTL